MNPAYENVLSANEDHSPYDITNTEPLRQGTEEEAGRFDENAEIEDCADHTEISKNTIQNIEMLK